MYTFWIWGVRNPCMLVAAACTVAGLMGLADWSISLFVLMTCALAGDAANHLARSARHRAERARGDAARLAANHTVRQLFQEVERDSLKKAA